MPACLGRSTAVTGWQRVDPTARWRRQGTTRRSLGTANQRQPAAGDSRPTTQLLRALRLGWDAVPEPLEPAVFSAMTACARTSLLKSLGIDELASLRMASLLGNGLLLALLPSLAWLWWRHRRPQSDPSVPAINISAKKSWQTMAWLATQPKETPFQRLFPACGARQRWPQQQQKLMPSIQQCICSCVITPFRRSKS